MTLGLTQPLTTMTYLLTPWCRVLLEQLTVLQLIKKFPAFHGTLRFITALTSVRHLSLSCASPIQSIYPHPTSWRSILILSTHLRLGLSSGLFPSGFPTKTLYTPLSSPIRATCPAHLINKNDYQWYKIGGKCDQCVGLTTLPSSYADSVEILGSPTSLHIFTFTRNPIPFIKTLARKMEGEVERFPALYALPTFRETERNLPNKVFILSPQLAQDFIA